MSATYSMNLDNAILAYLRANHAYDVSQSQLVNAIVSQGFARNSVYDAMRHLRRERKIGTRGEFLKTTYYAI